MTDFTRHELHGVVLNVISVDEYSPKSGTTDEVIVVGFYFIENAAAQEFNTFVQRGSFDIIDTEVSPNPDTEGHYIAFIEFERKDTFYEEFVKFLRDIENITGEVDWQAAVYTMDRQIPVDSAEFVTAMINIRAGRKSDVQFFDNSVDNVTVSEKSVFFGKVVVAEIAVIGKETVLNEHFSRDDRPRVMDPAPEAVAVARVLGPDYDVVSYRSKAAIFNYRTGSVAVINNLRFSV